MVKHRRYLIDQLLGRVKALDALASNKGIKGSLARLVVMIFILSYFYFAREIQDFFGTVCSYSDWKCWQIRNGTSFYIAVIFLAIPICFNCANILKCYNVYWRNKKRWKVYCPSQVALLMRDADPLTKFERRKRRADSDIPRLLDAITYQRRHVRLGVVLSMLSRRHVDLGMHAYFVMGDMALLKQHFYVASKLCAVSLHEDGGPISLDLDSFLVALLSDSPTVITLFSTLEQSDAEAPPDDPRYSQFYAHMFQLVLRDDHALLRQKIAVAAREAGKSHRNEFATGQDLYSLLLTGDKAGLEARLDQRARDTSVNPWIEDFFAGAAMLEAKLCWLKGIRVQTENAMIPMTLLPVQPLAQYDNVYEFLQPGWKPPLQGALGRLISTRLKRS